MKLIPLFSLTATKFKTSSRFLIFLISCHFIISCNGQEKINSSENETPSSNSEPEIIGTPPSFPPQPGVVTDTLLVSQYIRSIFQDSKGNMWFGTLGDGVVRYGPSTYFDPAEPLVSRAGSAQYKSLRTSEKTLRYFSTGEVFQDNKSSDKKYDNSVHAIAEDKNGNLWFGTDQGVIKYDGKKFRSYSEKDGLNNLWVGRKSILADKSGNIWAGTARGVFRYNPSADSAGGKSFSLFNLLPEINVMGIMEDSHGNIWFASQDNGVFRFDGKTIKNLKEKDGLGYNYAGGMFQDMSGNLWFTMKGGICKYDGVNFTEISTKGGIGGTEIWGIFGEKSGIIWITARGSTTRYYPSVPVSDPKAFTVFTVEDGINCCVQSMYQDKSGNMWWGTGQGLYRFDGNRFYQVKQQGPW